jgi:catechol 2,3-dioxygenase-like lactoylglutathione lyase family enzyme
MLALADVAVCVKDAKATAQWWAEKVGFGVTNIGEPGSHGLMVAPPGDRFVLHLCEGFGAVEPGNTGIAFMTDEIGPLVERMKAAGVEFTEPLKQESWGGHAKFADPDGNIFWLLGAPRPFVEKAASMHAPGRAPKARRRTLPARRGTKAARRR